MPDHEVADVAFRFVECINRADLEGLVDLMTEDHALFVFGDHDVHGRERQREAWQGYFDLCPRYMIHLREMHVRGDTAVMVGSTTGSHLELPRLAEFGDPLIWTAKIRDGRVSVWALHHLTEDNRRRLGISQGTCPHAASLTSLYGLGWRWHGGPWESDAVPTKTSSLALSRWLAERGSPVDLEELQLSLEENQRRIDRERTKVR